MALHQYKTEQVLPASIQEVWEFISSPANLKDITPPYMGFDIQTPDLPDKMYPGMIISYKVRPLFKIGMNWVTEITHVEPFEYFIDEQRKGPYAIWHHEHHVSKTDGGVLMKDIVSYQPPLGYLGDIANRLFIRRQLNEIFDFRRKALERRFNIYKP